jgi:hypothetical protein
MQSISIRRMFGAASVVLFIAGCSSETSSVTPGSHVYPPSQSSIRVPAGYRAVPGPALVGPLIVPINHVNRPSFIMPSASSEILYVSDATNSVVNMYDPTVPNPTPIGTISTGLNIPFGLAVDKYGVLYVANIGNNTVTEYKHGATTPFFTITGGMSSPYGIGVDSHRNVFVTNLGTNTVTGYKHGQTSPYETVSGVGPNPVGLAVDHSDNVFVADDSDNTIYEIPAGSSTSQNSGLTQLVGPIGVSFTTGDTLFVSNFGNTTVGIYPKGSTTPTGIITDGLTQPTLNGFAKPGFFFQSNQNGLVVGYRRHHRKHFSLISGLGNPTGIASYPRF